MLTIHPDSLIGYDIHVKNLFTEYINEAEEVWYICSKFRNQRINGCVHCYLSQFLLFIADDCFCLLANPQAGMSQLVYCALKRGSNLQGVSQ